MSKKAEPSGPPPEDAGLTATILRQWRRERPDLDLDALLIGIQISRVGLLSSQISEHLAGRFGIGAGEMLVLTGLRRQGAPYALRPTDLSRMLGVTSGTMTYRIDKVVGRGLAERAPDPVDGRVAVVQLTPDGVALADSVMQLSASIWSVRMSKLAAEPGGLARLETLLGEIIAGMEASFDGS